MKYKVEKYITYNTKVVGAVWNEEEGKWKVSVDSGGEIKEDDCHVLFSASGVLNNWKWPDISGIKDYKGKLLHSAAWDTEWYRTFDRFLMVGITLENQLPSSDAVPLLFRSSPKCKKSVLTLTITFEERPISVIPLAGTSQRKSLKEI